MAQPPPPPPPHPSSASSSSSLSNLIRLTPLQIADLPGHADLPPPPDSSNGRSSERPALGAFLTALLDDGAAFLEPSTFSSRFKHLSKKKSAPSAAPVEVLSHSIPASAIKRVQWSSSSGGPGGDSTPTGVDAGSGAGDGIANTSPRQISRVSRSPPPSSTLDAEYWIARRSVHRDISSKDATQPGHASWDEFVYGLRDNHSKHEADFTPTLYDAHRVADWTDMLHQAQVQETLMAKGYTACSLGVFEMCHAIPPPLSPRCFAVVVATANLDEDSFIAVTVPVDLTSTSGNGPLSTALYSTGRNVHEGATPQQRKRVVAGVYAAVETVRRRRRRDKAERETEAEIEWVMATTSDAKGSLPLWVQKLSVPGAVAKDVGYFLKWIRGVDDGEINKQPRQ
ncbi:hypothetical protein A1O3_08617 [Capronia epimyces CBS 606.96]|uniref:DUF3074 domain-containing protein n=1 Tax=Capronia epimyces CBS 606.96 TaxID=1182542 RepID=W9XQ55_9EURO|nr:uncharacterized protein A1O3_08617 [Capronia epimyces CBS 606.96]EXJ79116.1 hypothetical protein A1O3_08617 [Capronia epimyces CBS 606.96]